MNPESQSIWWIGEPSESRTEIFEREWVGTYKADVPPLPDGLPKPVVDIAGPIRFNGPESFHDPMWDSRNLLLRPIEPHPMFGFQNSYANRHNPSPPVTFESVRKAMQEIEANFGKPRRMEITVRPDPVKYISHRVKTHRRARIDKKWRKRYGYWTERVINTDEAEKVYKIYICGTDQWVMYRQSYDRLAVIAGPMIPVVEGDPPPHYLWGIPINFSPY